MLQYIRLGSSDGGPLLTEASHLLILYSNHWVNSLYNYFYHLIILFVIVINFYFLLSY